MHYDGSNQKQSVNEDDTVTLINSPALDSSLPMQALMAWVVDSNTRVPLEIEPVDFPEFILYAHFSTDGR